MPKRIAFVGNALAGPELKTGNRDTSRIFALLTDKELGQCECTKPLHECPTTSKFQEALHSAVANWNPEDQLVFYFSGHGVCQNGQYALVFGKDVRRLPFSNILNILEFEGVCSTMPL